MAHEKIVKVAEILVNYSTQVKKGDVVQILADVEAQDLAKELYLLVLKKGAYPRLKVSLPGTSYIYYTNASEEQLKKFPDVDMHELKRTDVVMYIGAPTNTRELTNVDPRKIAMRQKVMQPYQEYRVGKTRWVIFYYPTASLAQEAEMSFEEFENFVYDAVLIDYEKMSKSMDKLKKIIDEGNEVRIIGKNTNLNFSIKGRVARKGEGRRNVPDGEVFTSVVENSTQGHIEYEYPILYQNQIIQGIKLDFKDGKIVGAKADRNEELLHAVLNTDKGSRTLGEFGIGTNYNIKKYIKNILFDEKIGGTIHLAIGSSYKETLGKNKSSIHWDMVKDLKQGGRIIIDEKVIQENGIFKI